MRSSDPTAVSLFLERAASSAGRVALRVLEPGGAAPETVTWEEWAERSRRFAAALLASGHRPGDRVAILAGNRTEWPVADLGVLLAGGVSVGIYPTSAPGQVEQILSDAGAVAVITDRPEQRAKVEAARARVPSLRTVVCSDDPGRGAWGWDEWLAAGAAALEDGPTRAELERRIGAARPDDDALLIYTSGSTGEPKGARITHRYLLASSASIAGSLGLGESDTSLSFLPFCHAAERVFGLYTRILCGMEAGLVDDPSRVWEAARRYGPTLFGGLPRFFEKAYEALRAEQEAADGAERERWDLVLRLGRERSRARRAGRPFPEALDARWRAEGAPLFARARALFGGRARLVTSGGAAFPAEVAEYLDALSVTVLGAYGLTEHLCAAFNRPDRYTFDSAGPPMPGAEVRIAEDGEILLRRGPLCFAGYHGRPEETRAAFSADGEWLATGDLGEIDDRGLLRVTGRKKELIALSTGKKVAPLPIEARLVEDPWISQAVLYGEGRKFVSALLALRRPLVEAWARERGLDGEYAELLRAPELLQRVQAVVDGVNETLSRPERVCRWVLLERELTAEQEELTPTLKVRRPLVLERYGQRMDALYLSPEP